MLGLPDKIKGQLTLKKLENMNFKFILSTFCAGIEQTISPLEVEIGAAAAVPPTSDKQDIKEAAHKTSREDRCS